MRRVIRPLPAMSRHICRTMAVLHLSSGRPLTILVAMDIFSEMAGVYDIIAGDCSPYYDALLSAIRARYPLLEDAVLADIGGGTGLFTFHVCRRVKNVLLVDPSDAMLRIAREKLDRCACDNVRLVRGRVPGSGPGAGSVDIAVLIGTFQYLSREEQPEALREIFRCLKPGGLSFIDLTNYFAFVGQPVNSETKRWDANGLKIVQETSHEVHPFQEEWIDNYRITVENSADGSLKVLESRHVLKMLSPTEMCLLLRLAGFSGIEVTQWPDVVCGSDVKIWCFAKKPDAL